MDINLTAPINQLSYGVVGLNLMLALDRLGHKVALWPIGGVEAPPEHHAALKAAVDRTATYDRGAPSVRVWHQFELAQPVGKGTHAALPIFELDRFNARELNHLLWQDLVFAPSRWAAKVLEESGVPPGRIEYARLGVDRSIFYPALGTTERSSATTFLNVGKWEVRKAHFELCEAFNKAFTKDDDVRLILLTPNPFLSQSEAHEWHRLFISSPLGQAGKIQIIGERLKSQKEVAHLMAQADCGVFPSRAEGWNLDLAEMLAMGKHCIATNYSAHTEFCTPENCRLINIDELEPAYDGKWFFGQGRWAKFGPRQMDQLVEHLRAVHAAKQEGLLSRNEAGINTMARFTWENMTSEVVSVL